MMTTSLRLALAAITMIPMACVDLQPVSASRVEAPVPVMGPRPSTAAELRAAATAVNRHRAGCAPLAWDEAAARVAQAHSDDMARRGYFAHRSPDGREVAQRLASQGVRYRAVAENLGMGYGSGEEVVRGWMGSPGHRRNIQWCAVTRMGLGVRDNRWTLVLYTPLG